MGFQIDIILFYTVEKRFFFRSIDLKSIIYVLLNTYLLFIYKLARGNIQRRIFILFSKMQSI